MFKLPPLPRTLQAARADAAHPNVEVRISVAQDLAMPSAPEERAARVGLLEGLLQDADAKVRRAALVALADQEAVEATSAVLPLLSDGEPEVRQMAVMALGEIAEPGNAEVIARLVAFLATGAPPLRFQALSGLGRLSPAELRAALPRALGDADPEIRALSVRLLEERLLAEPDSELDDALRAGIEAAARDVDPRVSLVGQLLGAQLGLDVPHDALIDLVNGSRPARERRDEQLAIELCGRLGLRAASRGLRRRARGWFGMSFDPFRYQALASLSALGDGRASERIAKLLARGGLRERTLMVFAVGKVGLERFRPQLEALLDPPGRVDAEVLGTALEELTAAAGASAAG